MSVKLRLGLAEPTGGVTVILLSLDLTGSHSPPVQTKSRLGLRTAGESKTSLALAPLWGSSAVLTFQRVLVVSICWLAGLVWWSLARLVVLLGCPVLN